MCVCVVCVRACVRWQAELSVSSAKGIFPSSVALVTLTIVDVNDYRPTFSHSSYSATLSDCVLSGSVVSADPPLSVSDLDLVRFRYTSFTPPQIQGRPNVWVVKALKTPRSTSLDLGLLGAYRFPLTGPMSSGVIMRTTWPADQPAHLASARQQGGPVCSLLKLSILQLFNYLLSTVDEHSFRN